MRHIRFFDTFHHVAEIIQERVINGQEIAQPGNLSYWKTINGLKYGNVGRVMSGRYPQKKILMQDTPLTATVGLARPKTQVRECLHQYRNRHPVLQALRLMKVLIYGSKTLVKGYFNVMKDRKNTTCY